MLPLAQKDKALLEQKIEEQDRKFEQISRDLANSKKKTTIQEEEVDQQMHLFLPCLLILHIILFIF